MVRRRLANDFTGDLRGRSARNRKQVHQKERRFARYRAAVAPRFPPRDLRPAVASLGLWPSHGPERGPLNQVESR
jgi:hypothetical protein